MWDRKSLISVDQLSRSDIEKILSVADSLSGGPSDACKGKILANIFFEPSTRTEKSFQAAMYRLGGQVIAHKDSGSSREKGETKEDTIRVLSGYADIAVIRDDEEGKMARYAALAGVSVINAGDGSNEHPTQTLLDAFTILKERGRLDNLKIVFVGDLKYSRTIHSLMKTLSKFSGNRLYGIYPGPLSLPESMKPLVQSLHSVDEMKQALKEMQPDVIYSNRVQEERLHGEKANYLIDKSILEAIPEDCILMNPLPRAGELSVEIDSDKRVIPFKQAKNGIPVRMALLSMMIRSR